MNITPHQVPGIDLRQQVASSLVTAIDKIGADAAGIFPYNGPDALEPDYCGQVAELMVRALAAAVRDGRIDARSAMVADLQQLTQKRALSTDRIFAFAYLVERAALDEIALNDGIGASSEHWARVAQLVRRGSFDLLAALVERAQAASGSGGLTDALTTLHSRAMLNAVLAKEAERAGRFGHPLSLILFDVDHLSAINEAHGHGVGDQILERLGILIRQFFRHHDWTARHAGDSMAVVLVRTDPANASELAERVRATVEQRLGFLDHRTGQPVRVTVSAAVVTRTPLAGEVVDPERLMAGVEAALDRARREGGNRLYTSLSS